MKVKYIHPLYNSAGEIIGQEFKPHPPKSISRGEDGKPKIFRVRKTKSFRTRRLKKALENRKSRPFTKEQFIKIISAEDDKIREHENFIFTQLSGCGYYDLWYQQSAEWFRQSKMKKKFERKVLSQIAQIIPWISLTSDKAKEIRIKRRAALSGLYEQRIELLSKLSRDKGLVRLLQIRNGRIETISASTESLLEQRPAIEAFEVINPIYYKLLQLITESKITRNRIAVLDLFMLFIPRRDNLFFLEFVDKDGIINAKSRDSALNRIGGHFDRADKSRLNPKSTSKLPTPF